MKIRYRLVYNRKHHLNAMGEALVQIEAYCDGRKAYFGTGIYVKPGEWAGCEVQGRADAAMLNGMLTEGMVRLQMTEVAMWRCGVKPTLEHLRAGWREQRPAQNLMQFAQTVVNKSGRAMSTKENLMTTARLLEQWRPTCLHEVSYELLRDFEAHLRQRGNCQNTIVKHMRQLRTICQEAVRRGYLQRGSLPFDQLRLRQEPREHTVLSEAELRQIARATVHTDVRDAFLFCCSTGLRYSDYVRLSDSCFVQREGQTWIALRMQKTGHAVHLPVSELERLLGPLPPHPAIGSNNDVNTKLAAVARQAGLTKHVTFHAARHTFATRMLAAGVAVTTVQALLGHRSVRTTQRYAETRQQTIVSDLQRAQPLRERVPHG